LSKPHRISRPRSYGRSILRFRRGAEKRARAKMLARLMTNGESTYLPALSQSPATLRPKLLTREDTGTCTRRASVVASAAEMLDSARTQSLTPEQVGRASGHRSHRRTFALRETLASPWLEGRFLALSVTHILVTCSTMVQSLRIFAIAQI